MFKIYKNWTYMNNCNIFWTKQNNLSPLCDWKFYVFSWAVMSSVKLFSVVRFTLWASFGVRKIYFLWEPDRAQASWPGLSSWSLSMILSMMSSTLLPNVLEISVRYQIALVFLKDFKNIIYFTIWVINNKWFVLN